MNAAGGIGTAMGLEDVGDSCGDVEAVVPEDVGVGSGSV